MAHQHLCCKVSQNHAEESCILQHMLCSAKQSTGQERQVYSSGICCACIAQSTATHAKIANCTYTKCPTGTAVLLAIHAMDVVALEHRRAALPARQRVAQFNPPCTPCCIIIGKNWSISNHLNALTKATITVHLFEDIHCSHSPLVNPRQSRLAQPVRSEQKSMPVRCFSLGL